MRVAIVCLSDIRTQVDGVANYYKHLAENVPSGTSISYFIPTTDESHVETYGKVQLHYVHVKYAYEIYKGLRILTGPIVLSRMYRFFFEHFSINGFDTVQISSPDTFSCMALCAARNLNINVVGVYHTNIPEYTQYWFKHKYWWNPLPPLATAFAENWGRVWYNCCDVLVTPTKAIGLRLRKKGYKPQFGVIGRGVDTDSFVPMKKGRKPTVLFVGRLSPEKCIHELSFTEQLDVNTMIVGNGISFEELKEQLPSANFTGVLRDVELYRAYGKADVFVFPSRTETYANVINEALSAGLPVVTYDDPVYRDRIIDGENGFLVKTIDELREKTELLVSHTGLRKKMSIAARKSAEDLDWHAIARKQIQVYADFDTGKIQRRSIAELKLKLTVAMLGLYGFVLANIPLSIGLVLTGVITSTALYKKVSRYFQQSSSLR